MSDPNEWRENLAKDAHGSRKPPMPRAEAAQQRATPSHPTSRTRRRYSKDVLRRGGSCRA